METFKYKLFIQYYITMVIVFVLYHQTNVFAGVVLSPQSNFSDNAELINDDYEWNSESKTNFIKLADILIKMSGIWNKYSLPILREDMEQAPDSMIWIKDESPSGKLRSKIYHITTGKLEILKGFIDSLHKEVGGQDLQLISCVFDNIQKRILSFPEFEITNEREFEDLIKYSILLIHKAKSKDKSFGKVLLEYFKTSLQSNDEKNQILIIRGIYSAVYKIQSVDRKFGLDFLKILIELFKKEQWHKEDNSLFLCSF